MWKELLGAATAEYTLDLEETVEKKECQASHWIKVRKTAVKLFIRLFILSIGPRLTMIVVIFTPVCLCGSSNWCRILLWHFELNWLPLPPCRGKHTIPPNPPNQFLLGLGFYFVHHWRSVKRSGHRPMTTKHAKNSLKLMHMTLSCLANADLTDKHTLLTQKQNKGPWKILFCNTQLNYRISAYSDTKTFSYVQETNLQWELRRWKHNKSFQWGLTKNRAFKYRLVTVTFWPWPVVLYSIAPPIS